MSFDRRLSKLEQSPMALMQNGKANGGPLYTQSDFEEVADPVKLMEMFEAMRGRWHLVKCKEDDIWESLFDEQLDEIITGGMIKWEKVSDGQLKQIVDGHSLANVLGTNWQREYGYSHVKC